MWDVQGLLQSSMKCRVSVTKLTLSHGAHVLRAIFGDILCMCSKGLHKQEMKQVVSLHLPEQSG